jgi:hypothetical protein
MGTCSLKPDSACLGTLPNQCTVLGSNFCAICIALDVGIMVNEKWKDVDRSIRGMFWLGTIAVCPRATALCMKDFSHNSQFATLKLGHGSWRTILTY